ncbi:hypothetical protein S886_14610 [Salmonella enterica subsp. arizonae]|nr:hypothetical protein [Salmonella enterica]ECF6856563.1 hypothetical protein [Salmonella enterica subsp. arizonae]EDW1774674.1 hypothetical protein [Salmonella enterica subsp. diarizonae]EDW1845464.1 hypothetical protein [Salmonella enterica subsp. enterica]
MKERGITDGLTMNQLAERNAEHVATIEALEARCTALAAEGAKLKNPDNWLSQSDYGYEAAEVATQNGATEDESLRAGMIAIINRIETPAIDAFLAEVRASARNEGINYAASRLAAAFNHGFLDKPVSEVLDVTRMILSAKEDLANDPLPAADGLSGEYAEKAIEEWVAQLRKGGAA